MHMQLRDASLHCEAVQPAGGTVSGRLVKDDPSPRCMPAFLLAYLLRRNAQAPPPPSYTGQQRFPFRVQRITFYLGRAGGEGEGLEIILRVVKSEADTLYSLTESRL